MHEASQLRVSYQYNLLCFDDKSLKKIITELLKKVHNPTHLDATSLVVYQRVV